MAFRMAKICQAVVISLVTLVTGLLMPPAVHGSSGTEGSTETRVLSRMPVGLSTDVSPIEPLRPKAYS